MTSNDLRMAWLRFSALRARHCFSRNPRRRVSAAAAPSHLVDRRRLACFGRIPALILLAGTVIPLLQGCGHGMDQNFPPRYLELRVELQSESKGALAHQPLRVRTPPLFAQDAVFATKKGETTNERGVFVTTSSYKRAPIAYNSVMPAPPLTEHVIVDFILPEINSQGRYRVWFRLPPSFESAPHDRPAAPPVTIPPEVEKVRLGQHRTEIHGAAYSNLDGYLEWVDVMADGIETRMVPLVWDVSDPIAYRRGEPPDFPAEPRLGVTARVEPAGDDRDRLVVQLKLMDRSRFE